ncbi:30S ribosomal protein S16 [Patescibacteria group bacterium]|nr:30S ribosomal protein S16 [Patescibacteria group bacterium]
MLKIKLQPTGKRNQRLFRIVVAEDRSKLTGKYIDLLGHYDPHHPQNKITLDKTLYDSWVNKGAQPTNTLRLLINKKTL